MHGMKYWTISKVSSRIEAMMCRASSNLTSLVRTGEELAGRGCELSDGLQKHAVLLTAIQRLWVHQVLKGEGPC